MVGSGLEGKDNNMTEQTSLGFTTAGHFGRSALNTANNSSFTTTTATASTTTATAGVAAATATLTTINNNNNNNNRDYPLHDNLDDIPSPSLHSHRQNHSSSKLPAFRFVDLKPGSTTPLAHPVLTHLGPPTPVSPASAPDPSHTHRESIAAGEIQTQNQVQVQTITRDTPQGEALRASAIDDPQAQQQRAHNKTSSHQEFAPATTGSPSATATPSVAATSAPSSSPSPNPVTGLLEQARSPYSHPQSSPDCSAPQALPPPTNAVAKPEARRAPALRSFSLSSTSTSTPAASSPALRKLHRRSTADLALSLNLPSPDKSSLDSPSGQRELILPKTLSQSNSPDERRASLHRSPPVSYRPPVTATSSQPSTAGQVRVPPIRAFRSSGSRKSLGLDMNLNFNTRPYESIDDASDLNHDDTLRALEGRFEPESTPLSPSALSGPTLARQENFDNDDTGDVFLKIAREEDAARQSSDGSTAGEMPNAVSRVRSSHRRPLSTTVAAYHPTTPPQLSRRLSDQQDTSRSRRYDDDRANDVSRITTYRSIAREKVASIFPGEDLIRARPVGSALRPSSLTSRAGTAQEPSLESQSQQHRRRPSMGDPNATVTPRSSAYRPMGAGHSHARSHGSSPLIKSIESQSPMGQDSPHGVEGTESSASTAAPSTVWDELDDLKSRIHRLELTGKLPATSGAAISRLSDERPPTATTTMTTVSSSPKRSGGGAAAQPTDATSTISSHRDAHPLLQSALAKSKLFLNPEVFRALESAANDAMALSSMMGSPGQPGPISSGNSTIGTGGAVTDRQLRRKAESVCRSLTELCVALGEEVTNSKPASTVVAPQPIQHEVPSTPLATKTLTLNTASSQRRQSVADPDSSKSLVSPRAMSKFEERRNSILNGTTLPSPRVINSIPSTPNETTPNRRSSLMIARSRRAGTEEPEDGRKSSILRTRRAGTEEPEEGRKTSLLVRNRRGTVGEEEDSRVQSRATDLYGIRHVPREYQPQAHPQGTSQQGGADAVTQVSTTLPRRRFVSSSLQSSRLATPSTPALAPPKKYLERSSTLERDPGAGSTYIVEERPVRHASLGQSTLLNRSGSLSTRRQNRDSTYTTVSTTATAGGYRS